MFRQIKTLLRHRWFDGRHARRALGAEAAQQLTQRVAASEQRHTGQVRICVEAGLPLSYLWRHAWHGEPMHTVLRQRALMLFAKFRIWDTEQNNGVLIYLSLVERRIEVVADRGLSQHVTPAQWQKVVSRLGAALQAGRFEQGLTLALAEVSTLLEQLFPASQGSARVNEIADSVLRM